MLTFLQSRSTSDSEHIDRISKTIEFWDRWRKSILFASLIALVGILGFLAWLANFVVHIPANNALAIHIKKIPLGIAFGFGVTLGFHLHSVMGYIISSALGGYRSERMLLKLYAESRKSSPDVKWQITHKTHKALTSRVRTETAE